MVALYEKDTGKMLRYEMISMTVGEADASVALTAEEIADCSVWVYVLDAAFALIVPRIEPVAAA